MCVCVHVCIYVYVRERPSRTCDVCRNQPIYPVQDYSSKPGLTCNISQPLHTPICMFPALSLRLPPSTYCRRLPMMPGGKVYMYKEKPTVSSL